jgi:hypothetical protein
MVSCMGFLLRHGDMVSYMVVTMVNIRCDLITHYNTYNFIILPRCTMGDIIFL